MEIIKQDKVMNEIIHEITHGEKKSGEMILSRDYDLAKKQMGMLYKKLLEKEIVIRTASNYYFLTENCVANAQEMYFEKIIELIKRIKVLADSADISAELLLDVFKNEIED